MGLFGDLKRILFGAKSVSKGAIDKSIDYTKEKSEHLLEVGEDVFNDKKEILDERFANLKAEASKKRTDIVKNLKEKSEEIIEDITESELYKKSSETLGRAGDAILDTGEKFIEKSKDFIDGPGKEVAEKFKETSENIGETILEGGKAVLDKTNDIKDKFNQKLEETIQKSEELAKREKANPTKGEFADTPFEVKDSELEDKGDFFEKADKFASGDYSSKSNPQILDTKTEKTRKMSKNIEGFKDRDNDGDPLIDDADIINDEK